MTTPYERFLESKAVSAPERGYITQRRPRPSAEWLRDQYETQGRDCVQIARDLKIDPKTAWEWIRAAGIETRKRGFGHPANLFQKGKCSGSANAHAGHHHSAKARQLVGKASRARNAVPYLKNGVHWLKGTSGAVNPNWRGGITPERQTFYRTPEWKACVKIVWKRDKATCQRCALAFSAVDRKTRTFDIHHIDSFAIVERRSEPDNLILLCDNCHDWVHSKQNAARLFLGNGHERRVAA